MLSIHQCCHFPSDIQQQLDRILASIAPALEQCILEPGACFASSNPVDATDSCLASYLIQGLHYAKPIDCRYGNLNVGCDPRLVIIRALAEHVEQFPRVRPSGEFFYGQAGGQGWHTNYNPDIPPGILNTRIYLVYNGLPGSEFRWRDAVTGKIETIVEPVGWSANIFDLTNPCWHAITSSGDRMSLGLEIHIRANPSLRSTPCL